MQQWPLKAIVRQTVEVLRIQKDKHMESGRTTDTIASRTTGLAGTIRRVSCGRLLTLGIAAMAFVAAILCVHNAEAQSAGRPSPQETNADAAWPMYRRDKARSACATQALSTPLSLQWSHVSAHPPRPAWPEPGKEVHRMAFDYAHQITSAKGRVFFGSSADHKVYALDLASGKELWSSFTEGPVRFAPCVSGNRVYVASDDGCLYCLNSSDGKQIWRFRGGPRDERLLGNGQLISRWPARSGVLVDKETAYFTAGMWGPDGVSVYALRSEDGSVIWNNNTSNQQYMLLPHNNYEGISGVSPQGYLALDDDILLVPTGRAMPARFDRATGRLLPWRIAWGKHHRPGSSWTMTASGLFFGARRRSTGLPEPSLGEDSRLRPEGLMAWDLHSGQAVFALEDVYRALLSDNTLYLTGGGYSGKGDGHVMAVDLASLPKGATIPAPHTLGHEGAGVSPMMVQKQAKWQTPTGRTYELIKSGKVLVAGGRDVVRMIAADSGEELWKAGVEGQARALAVASGRLLVSTSAGRIYCFGEANSNQLGEAKGNRSPLVNAEQADDGPSQSHQTELAKQVIEKCGIRSGYCLVLGLDDPELPLALVQQSDLQVIVRDENEERIARARRRYDRLGYYGVRIAIHQGDLRALPYSQYFANLIVVGRPASCDARQAYRCLRPCGGVLAVLAGDKAKEAQQWLATTGDDSEQAVVDGDLVRVRRGPLPGAGSWSHPFANVGRTSASRDELVRLPLKTLWFGGPGPARMVDRHRFPPIPVSANGRLFVPGQNCIIGVDAYNGREMWSRELEGVGRFPGQDRGASVVADDRCVYVPHGVNCLQLDGDTGETLQTYEPPAEIRLPAKPTTKAVPKDRKKRFVFNEVEWNYLAVTDHAILGTVGAAQVRRSFANWPIAAPRGEYLFALNKDDGKTLWVYESKHAVTPKSIVADSERVYLLDQENERGTIGQTTVRALDINTGAPVWSAPVKGRWELLLEDDCLVAAGTGYTVYHADSGKVRWSNSVPFDLYDTFGAGVDHYRWSVALRDFPVIPPMIVNGKIVAPPRAFDLKTGEEQHLACPLSGEELLPFGVGNGGCGTYSGCPALMFMRSGSLGIYDMAEETGMHWLGQVRPSCWINTLPTGGIVLMPEGSSSCSCAYSFQTSLALVADTRHEEWGVYTCQPPKQGSCVKTLSFNFGAMGDKRDRAEKLWLGFPRPFSPQALKVPFKTCAQAEYYRQNADEISIAGTDRPWLYSCGVENLETATLDLNLTRPAVVLEAKDTPQLDGKLDDACWDEAEPIEFVDDSRRVDSRIHAWLRHDADNIYVGFLRHASRKDGKLVPWTTKTKGDNAPTWQDDSLKVRFLSGSDPFSYFFLSASGARFTGQGGRAMTIKPAKQAWRDAVHVTPAIWSAEIAIPASVKEGLQIFLESFNRTGVGPERTFYKFRSWRRWFVTGGEADLAFERPPALPSRRYTVRLHFAELDQVRPGQRVFDVKVQNKTVIKGLDVVSEADGRRTALIKQIEGVIASDTISIGLVPTTNSTLPTILSAIEIARDEPADFTNR